MQTRERTCQCFYNPCAPLMAIEKPNKAGLLACRVEIGWEASKYQHSRACNGIDEGYECSRQKVFGGRTTLQKAGNWRRFPTVLYN